jgi:hypothetical protein
VELVGAETLLTGSQQMGGEKPDIQLDLAALKDGSNRHGELTMTGVALVQAGATGLAFQPMIVLEGPAMRADRTI